MDWSDKAAALPPITREYAAQLIEKNRAASSYVTACLVGMVLRRDSFAAPSPAPSPSADDPGAWVDGVTGELRIEMTDCLVCEGAGQVTADEFEMAVPRVLREIARDREGNPSQETRTEAAIRTGVLKFQDCDACNGSGEVPA